MNKIRVLVVDDAVVVRKMVTDVLTADPMLEVAGIAANGRIALQKIPQVNPDVITLDMEMPDMDGLETLREIRKSHPRLPVIMFSTLTERGAMITLEALALGASDYVTKPANVGSVGEGLKRIEQDLIPKIKALCPQIAPAIVPAVREKVFIGAESAAQPARTFPTSVRRAQSVDILAIGVSTGGPNALAELLPQLPGDFPVPIVIVQHMPPIFTRLLAERLNEKCSLSIAEPQGGEALEPGQAWIAPGGSHMVLERDGARIRLRLNQDPPENSCRPAVDVLFRSASKIYGSGVLAVVLTGMGQDGLLGCQGIAAQRGQILAQDEASSVVWGMPGYVAQAGLAEKVLPLNQMAGEIIHRTTKRI